LAPSAAWWNAGVPALEMQKPPRGGF
jgi:hypothetical protein